jgi:hypothetical protein
MRSFLTDQMHQLKIIIYNLHEERDIKLLLERFGKPSALAR